MIPQAPEVLEFKIEQLIDKGKKQGYISSDELDNLFVRNTSWPSYLDDLLWRLREAKIEVRDEDIASQLIVEREISARPPNDPIRTYLNEISQIPILTAEQEKEMAREMEMDSLRINEIEAKTHLPLRKLKPLGQKWQEKSIKKKELPGTLAKLTNKEIDKIFKKLDALEIKIEETKKRFVEANLRLVVSIAKRFSHAKLSLLDMINEGNLGLIQAVNKFDYKEGYKFSTYAIWWIKQAISRSISEQGRIIRIPVYMIELINRCLRTINGLTQEFSREPTLDEIANRMNLSVAKIIEIINISQEPASLEAPVGAEGDSQLGDLLEDRETLPPTKTVFLSSLQEQINKMLESLDEKERIVIQMRYGLNGETPHTLEDVGQAIHVTRERVRQMEKKILDKLRKTRITKSLHDFLAE